MSSEAGQDDDAPVAPDRPVVDGSETSAAELRAAAEAGNDPEVERVEVLREDVIATAEELRDRLDLRPRIAAVVRPVVIALAAVALAALVTRRRRKVDVDDRSSGA